MWDWVVDYNGEGQEWAANNNGIRHLELRWGCCFWQGSYIFLLWECCFWQGLHDYFWVWGLANKRESCTYNSVYYLRREKMTENTLNITFLGDVLVPLYGCMLFYWKYNIGCIFKTTYIVAGFINRGIIWTNWGVKRGEVPYVVKSAVCKARCCAEP